MYGPRDFHRKKLAAETNQVLGSVGPQALLDGAPGCISLTHTAIPQRGSITPTFTRATAETGQKWDEAGYLDFTALAGEMVFKGARREGNLVKYKSEDLTNTSQWASSGTASRPTATTALFPASGDLVSMPVGGRSAVSVGAILQYSFEVSGSGTVRFFANDGVGESSLLVTLTSTPTEYAIKRTSTGTLAHIYFGRGLGDETATGVTVDYVQISDITGETDQTTIRPYVSVGVESAPSYHGSMVDGVKCYDTDRSGNPITQTTTYEAVTLNGVAGSYVSTPDGVAVSTIVNADVIAKLTPVDWTPAALAYIGGTDPLVGAPNRTWYFSLNTSGKLLFGASIDGSAANIATSSVAVGASDGTAKWVRVTRTDSTGVQKFYTSDDGVTWVQLGTDITTTAGVIFDSASKPLLLGNIAAGGVGLVGKLHKFQLYSNGTLAVDFDASRYAGGTTLTGSTGETWTLNGSAVIHPTNYPLVGYVPWEARTNLCLQSNAFGTAPWGENSGAVTIAQNAIGPDGAISAWTFTDDQAGNLEGRVQAVTLTAATWTISVFVEKTTGAQAAYPVVYAVPATTLIAPVTIDTSNGVATAWTSYTGRTIATGLVAICESFNELLWRVSFSFTATAENWTIACVPAGESVASYAGPAFNATLTGSAVFYGAMGNLGAFAGPYVPAATTAVIHNADVCQYPTTAGPIAAAGAISLDFTPYHAPSGTIALWGTYVDASNYTAILHDATNLIFRKRIAGSNYDATIANAFVSGTTYKIAATWGAAGTAIYLDGVAGTPHANTTAAQIAATMQVGADGNSLQQPGAGTTNLRIWQRQLSDSEGKAITA